MKKISVTKNNDLLENAKDLRRRMTRHEKHLWYDYLQNYPIKIYKQRIIDNYIADFYCHKAHLVIELDGSQHYSLEGKFYDKARSEVLEQYGLLVLRFSNTDIDENFDGVCRMIDKVINKRIEETIKRPSQSPCGDSSPKGEPYIPHPNVSKGKEIKMTEKFTTETEENTSTTEAQIRECADAALVLIRFSSNSRKMLEEKLVKRGYPKDVVKIALDNLENGGFINDKQLLYAYAYRLATVKLYGKYRIRLDLCRKFDKETVNKYLDYALEDVNFEEYAEKLAEKYASYGKTYVCSKLRRNGYTTQEIRYATRDLEDD